MKSRKNILITAALLSAMAISGTALADRGSGHFGGHGGFRGHGFGHGFGHVGAFFGGALVASAFLSPWYYPGPYYSSYPYYASYPDVVQVAAPGPTVYVEQPRAAQPAAPDAGSWWYYCNESRSYYPYVRECASPWQRVAPTPPAAR